MNRTDFLFATPNFFRGFGRAIDLGSTRNIYNDSTSEKKADYKALKSDWYVTGKDIRKAIEQYNNDRITRKKR